MRHPLTFRWVVCIITKYEITSTRPMYENEFEFNNEFYSTNLDEMYSYEMCEHYEYHNHHNQHEMYDTYEMDDEYARDTYDVQELAYRHYA